MKRLFDGFGQVHDYTEIQVDGFGQKVPGIVFTEQKRPCCGVPLGGIGTGCIDFDLSGTFGWSSIFHPYSQILAKHQEDQNVRIPRQYPVLQPVFAFSIGENCYIAATEEIQKGGRIPWCTAPSNTFFGEPPQDYLELPEIKGVNCAREIQYYGHYPVADVEYSFNAPVSMGVRAWSSFLPGDAAGSNIPAAVFEVWLRNASDGDISGNLAMNFGGPNPQEARGLYFEKKRVEEAAVGMFVCSDGDVNYFLGVMDEAAVMTGTGLMEDHMPEHGYGIGFYAKPSSYSDLQNGLPQDKMFFEKHGVRQYQDPSASVGISYSLKAGEEKCTRFVLTWYDPVIDAAVRRPKEEKQVVGVPNDQWINGRDWKMDEPYGHFSHHVPMYTTRYDSSLDVMRRICKDHNVLLRKVLAWQEVLLTWTEYPAWLRDSLVNNFSLYAELLGWYAPKYPLGDWAFPNGGVAYYESPRDCPHTGCVPNDWIGTVSMCYFFPELYLQMLRAYKAAQREDGEIPFALGRIWELPNLFYPEFSWQVSLNGTAYIMMVDRLWKIYGDDSILKEFYPSIRRCHDFMRGLSRHGWLGMPDMGGSEWYEFSTFYGLTSHVGGLHLAQLLVVEQMALHMGETEYAQKCRRDFEESRVLYEEKLWHNTHYINWLDEENQRIDDSVMAYQFDGFYAAKQLGIDENIYDPLHLKTGLETIYQTNVKLGNGKGATHFAKADGHYLDAGEEFYGVDCVFIADSVLLGMTYMYAGEMERGLEIAEKSWRYMTVDLGKGWDGVHAVSAVTGQPEFGDDYNQTGVLWALPAALAGGDLGEPCKPGGIVEAVLKVVQE